MNTRTKIIPILTLLLVPILLTGCLLTASRESEVSGAYVHPLDVLKVRIDHTTIQEAEELLGLPSNTTTNDDGSETWTWHWSKHTDSKGTVFILFKGNVENTTKESVHIKFVDGIAVKKWRD
ncbi:MAG: hypothetical protein JKY43_04870 [Phycisphaerales bacterium]|nr:hypothetical protein [Phycisphaerales bacterium]